MKFSIVSLAAAFTGLVAAQGSTDLPSCAGPCVTKYATGTQIGGCSNLDIKCICSSGTFLTNIACCLKTACDTDDQAAATTYALSLCATAGVTVTGTVNSLCPDNSTSSSSESVSSTASALGSSSASVSASASATAATAATTAATTAASTTPSAAAAKAIMLGGGVGAVGMLAGLLAFL